MSSSPHESTSGSNESSESEEQRKEDSDLRNELRRTSELVEKLAKEVERLKEGECDEDPNLRNWKCEFSFKLNFEFEYP